MSYTKYIISSAAALALLTGCGGDSDDKKTESNLVTVTQENAAEMSSSVQQMSFMSLLFSVGFNVGMFVDEEEKRSDEEVVIPPMPTASLLKAPIFDEELSCNNEDGNHTISRTENNGVLTYVGTYTNCDISFMGPPGRANGVSTWVFSYDDQEDRYTKEFDINFALTVPMGPDQNGTLSVDLEGVAHTDYDLSEVGLFNDGPGVLDGDLMEIELDGEFSMQSSEYNSTIGWKNFNGEFGYDDNASSSYADIKGSFVIEASMNEEMEEENPEAPALADGPQEEVSCVEFLGQYNVDTMGRVMLDGEGGPFGSMSAGTLKLNNATFTYSDDNVSVKIGSDDAVEMEQHNGPSCVSDVLPFFI